MHDGIPTHTHTHTYSEAEGDARLKDREKNKKRVDVPGSKFVHKGSLAKGCKNEENKGGKHTHASTIT